MLNCPAHQTVIEAIKASLALLFYSGFFLGGRPLNVINQQRNKRHGNHQRTEQGRSHNDGEALEKIPSVAAEQEKWEIGNDVRQSRVEDCRGKLSRSQPSCYTTW